MDIAWIKRQLDRPGKSQAGLAKAMGIEPSGVSRMLRGEREIKVREIPKIRAYFEEEERAAPQLADLAETAGSNQPWGRYGERIPVLGVAEGGASGDIGWNGEVVDRVVRPPSLVGAPGGYAVYVAGDSMSPRYEAGELVYVHPGRPLTPGCYCVVQFGEGRGGAPKAFVKQYLRRTAKDLVLHQFNPDKDIHVPLERLISVHRIVGSGEP